MKKNEVNNNQKKECGKIKTILSIWSFKCKRYPDGRIIEHKARFGEHGVSNKWGVNYW